MSATIAELVFHLDRAIPFAWAEPWDRVGLLVGDPVRPLTRVYVTLDATASALRRARDAGAGELLDVGL